MPKFSKPVYNYMSKPYNLLIRSKIPISVYFYMISRSLPDCKSYTDIIFGSFTKIVHCCSKRLLHVYAVGSATWPFTLIYIFVLRVSH